MSAAAPVLLAAVGGAAIAVALRDWLAALPALQRWIEAAIGALMLAGRENRAPSEAERRRLGILTGAVLAAIAVLLTGSIALAGFASAGPAAAGWAVEVGAAATGSRLRTTSRRSRPPSPTRWRRGARCGSRCPPRPPA